MPDRSTWVSTVAEVTEAAEVTDLDWGWRESSFTAKAARSVKKDHHLSVTGLTSSSRPTGFAPKKDARMEGRDCG